MKKKRRSRYDEDGNLPLTPEEIAFNKLPIRERVEILKKVFGDHFGDKPELSDKKSDK